MNMLKVWTNLNQWPLHVPWHITQSLISSTTFKPYNNKQKLNNNGNVSHNNYSNTNCYNFCHFLVDTVSQATNSMLPPLPTPTSPLHVDAPDPTITPTFHLSSNPHHISATQHVMMHAKYSGNKKFKSYKKWLRYQRMGCYEYYRMVRRFWVIMC